MTSAAHIVLGSGAHLGAAVAAGYCAGAAAGVRSRNVCLHRRQGAGTEVHHRHVRSGDGRRTFGKVAGAACGAAYGSPRAGCRFGGGRCPVYALVGGPWQGGRRRGGGCCICLWVLRERLVACACCQDADADVPGTLQASAVRGCRDC